MQWGDARVPDSLWARIIPIPETGCLLWLGALCGGDYGLISFTVNRIKRSMVAHRRIYMLAFGEEADPELELDHRCRVRSCVNLDHLQLVTPQINTLMSTGPAAVNAAKDACPFGHAYDEKNTRRVRYRDRNSRRCITCTRIRELDRPSRAQVPAAR